MRRLIVLAAFAAAMFMPAPAAADPIINPYIVRTAPDAAGCRGVEVHGEEGLILTLAPWDGADGDHCANLGRQITHPLDNYGHQQLIFTWKRVECCVGVGGCGCFP